ncbi:putative receptor-like protein kinase At4g00960 [Triticum dicoccoides]|uniref:putative receptor-like protein kinase At4g00960 n=1 Tax=Triticum dicoccoides TaxID=85692 RepID=UPI00188E8BFA|nr:putative receptor-like protein kinase At4g00960 [Triticum dicoccoides]
MDHEVLEHIIDGRQRPKDLPFSLLKDITENFSDDREIGHGGFATVYLGVLQNGKTIAVKRIRSNHSINETLFRREVDTLLNIEHENVVRFLGFCASTNQIAIRIQGLKEHIYAEVRERLLCFEYISNGSLRKYITDELRGLEWNTRYQIIRGICEDNDMMPKITDFGLSRLDEKSQTMSEERLGTLGYCAPEYLRQGKMSFKSDMYSLGVIIIELVTGQNAPPNKNDNALRRWRNRWKKTGKETQLAYQQVAKCLEIGLLCQEIDPSKRPYIWQMIHDVREIDGPNEKISNAYEHTFEQISPCIEDGMLGIEPLELHFPFALNKQMSCALSLTNETDSYIAFNVENTSPLSYCTQPQKGIMPPQSKCNVDITLQLQGKAPGYMHRANELIVWSTKVNDCLIVEDITTNMFINEAVNVVDEVNLDVCFDASELQEASKKSSEVSYLRILTCKAVSIQLVSNANDLLL